MNKKIRIGVLCPSEIAFRRFVPSLLRCDGFEYVGVAVASKKEWESSINAEENLSSIIQNEYEKAQKFVESYGGKIYDSYENMISDDLIDAVYIPLPPALHYKWGRKAVVAKKHLFMEKPFTTDAKKSKKLIELAKENDVAVHENYMFVYHSQIEHIKEIIESGDLGEIRNIKTAFTFPMREKNDFRYKKELGGGALLDCGGYPIRLMTELMKNPEVVASRLYYIDGFEVDFYGSVMLCSQEFPAQVCFGMDNTYKCELEIQGNKGLLYTDRIFTAPDDFVPRLVLKNSNEVRNVELKSDCTFSKSILRFHKSILNKDLREKMYSDIIKQAELIEQVKE